MLLRTVMGSLRRHLCSSSCIFSTLAGLRAQRHPFREVLPFLFSTFSKHLFKERLCRTEFFQPSGAVWNLKKAKEVIKEKTNMKTIALYATMSNGYKMMFKYRTLLLNIILLATAERSEVTRFDWTIFLHWYWIFVYSLLKVSQTALSVVS